MYSGLTLTSVLRYINRRLGSTMQEIELSEEEIIRIVLQESLITYSKYFPYRFRMILTEKDSIGGGYSNTYRIPNDEHLEITGVHRVWLTTTHQYGSSIIPLVNDPFQTQFFNDLVSRSITPTTVDYQAPNLVTIRPKISHNNGGALIELNVVHPKHLKTIPITMRDEFLRLCLDDVLISLYPLRHRFESFNTPFGTIQPFLEMVDGAAGDRDELLNKWAENFLKDSKAKRMWIA